jgi:hypothetical protein
MPVAVLPLFAAISFSSLYFHLLTEIAEKRMSQVLYYRGSQKIFINSQEKLINGGARYPRLAADASQAAETNRNG